MNDGKIYTVLDLPGEHWKPINEFPLYQVSNLGRIKRSAYEKWYSNSKLDVFYPELLMKQFLYGSYYYVTLVHYGIRRELRVNRLVAKAFVQNPDSKKYTIVNHISEDKTDNRAINLMWTSSKGNANWGTRNKRISNKNKGREFTDEHRKHLSEAMKGNKNRLGKKNSQNQIEATSKANSKPVFTTDMSFKSIREAANYFNVRYETFARWISGKRKMPDQFKKIGLQYKK